MMQLSGDVHDTSTAHDYTAASEDTPPLHPQASCQYQKAVWLDPLALAFLR